MGLTAKVSETGEVVLPASVSEASGWKAGGELEIVQRGAEVMIRPAGAQSPRPTREEMFPPITLEEFFARVPKYDGPPVSVEDMDKAVMEEAQRRWHAKGG